MMHFGFEALGTAIEAARKQAGLTQQALAQSLHMSRATLSGIENGTVPEIGIRKVIAICAMLGLELIARPAQARPTLEELRDERRGRPPGT
jgi:HTH-type transcriptional regulator / antitoxin HipB